MVSSRSSDRGIVKAVSALLGLALLLFGLWAFFYGLLLFGMRDEWAESFFSPFRNSLLMYVPEVVLVSGACTFVLGIYVLNTDLGPEPLV